MSLLCSTAGPEFLPIVICSNTTHLSPDCSDLTHYLVLTRGVVPYLFVIIVPLVIMLLYIGS